MESEELMILRDLPVDTRNYTIVDNITGKPIEQSGYTLTIDPEVIKKLNKLKQVNEEKIKQASLKEQYGKDSLVSTFTPTDNAVFTPVYNDEYISYQDYRMGAEEKVEEVVEEKVEEISEDPTQAGAEVIMSDTLLDRVVARDPKVKLAEEEARAEEEAKKLEKEDLDYITAEDIQIDGLGQTNEESAEMQADNSLFTPEMATLQQASEQIVNIDTEKLGQDLKRTKERKKGTEEIKLDKMEIIAGKKIAWTAYILFFIPLLFKRKNRFVRLHANEGLELNIMELLGALLVGQYFLLPNFMELTGIAGTLSVIGAIIGASLIGVCIITIIPMIINAMLGRQVQNPWLWKRRIIHVSTERTSD